MKASEMIEKLSRLMREYGDVELVYSSDDDRDLYSRVEFQACAGNFSEMMMGNLGQFVEVGIFEKYQMNLEVNAICIN